MTYRPGKIFSSWAIVLLGCLVVACGAKKENRVPGMPATEPAPRLDPYSVPLYEATKQSAAPDFQIRQINGEPFQLSAHKDDVILLNIWATWCAPCRREMPDFQELHEQYSDSGLVMLGVSIDEQGESVVRPFLEEYGITYPNVVDDGTIMDKYGPTMAIPTSYIVGKDGNLRYFAVGALTKKELEPRLQKLLRE